MILDTEDKKRLFRKHLYIAVYHATGICESSYDVFVKVGEIAGDLNSTRFGRMLLKEVENESTRAD